MQQEQPAKTSCLKLIDLKPEEALKPRWSDDFFSNSDLKVVKPRKKTVPVILDRQRNLDLDIDRHKYQFRKSDQMSTVLLRLQNAWKGDAEHSLILYVIDENGKPHLPCMQDMISDIYQQWKTKSGYLYIVFEREKCFG